MAGVVFDTSGILALEADNLGAKMIVRECRRRNQAPLLPSVVVAEWWDGRVQRRRADIIESCRIVNLDLPLARLAGEARAAAAVSPVDAVVAAVAAQIGATVITQDEADFMRLRGFFPGLKFRRP